MTAPATGRTAEENEMRDALDTIKATIRSYVERTIWKPEREYFTAVLGLFAPTERLLAQLQADLIAARKERDEWEQAAKVEAAERRRLNDQLRESALDHLARDISDEQEAANLIALAKMYGEACGALAEYRFAAVEWQGEQAEYKAAVEAEAAHLRAENANLRDRVREAEGAAEALPDMLRKCRFQSAVIDSLSEKIGNARRMTNGWAKGTLLLLPFVDMAAGEGLEWAEQDDGSPRMDAADLCAAFAKAMGLEIGDAAYMAMIAEGRDAIRALSPEPQEAGDHEPR